MIFKILVGIITVYEDELLIIRRSLESKYLPGEWTFVCGHIRWGEQVEAAVMRELQEETFLKGNILGILGVNEWVWREKDIHHLQLNYVVKVFNDKVQIDNSSMAFKWINKMDIRSCGLLDDYNREMFAQYEKSPFF